jgi:hypothetical protein
MSELDELHAALEEVCQDRDRLARVLAAADRAINLAVGNATPDTLLWRAIQDYYLASLDVSPDV